MGIFSRFAGAAAVAALTAATIATTAGAAGAAMPRHAPPQHTPPRHAPSRTAARHALVLREGSSGPAVRALQRRLAALQYYPGSTDGSFGNGTLEAVWAFQEVNHLPVSGDVGSATRWALAHPRAYRARYPRQDGTRVEVNLGMGVLAFFRHGRIALISHVSSGGHYYFPCSGGGTCYAETPTGEFHALYFVPGWDQGPLGAMYNPVFFNYNGYAIHGDSSVPANPVSHGCVRIPMDVAAWFHRELHVNEAPGHGTQVWIYNQW